MDENKQKTWLRLHKEVKDTTKHFSVVRVKKKVEALKQDIDKVRPINKIQQRTGTDVSACALG
jgi:hypothetical protein